MAFKIVRNDIVKMDTDAIVNTANSRVVIGAGCDSAVYEAAGKELLLAYRSEHIGEAAVGDAFITPGFGLKAKYIIHAVSPLFLDGNSGEEAKLRACYRNSLRLAKENGITSIAFPLISTGGFGYPKEEGMRIAIDEIYDFLFDNDMDIYLVVFDSKATMLGEKLYPDLKSYIDHNYVHDKRRKEYNDEYFGSYRPGSEGYLDYTRRRDEMELRLMKNHVDDSYAAYDMVMDINEEDTVFEKSEVEDKCSEIDYDELKRKLDERQAHLADTFSEYLLYLIERKGLNHVDVYKRAIVDRKLFAKIKSDATYHPQKLTCLCLCVGAELSLDDTKDLLARAGYALSPSDMRDVIFSYFIEHEHFDMVDIDIQLEEYGIPCIIA